MTKRGSANTRQNSPSHRPNDVTPPNPEKPPLNHIEYLPLTIEQDTNQPKRTRYGTMKWQSTTKHDQNGENGSIFPIFIDGPAKPAKPIQHFPCVVQSIPETLSERINEKGGETMTKTPKRRRTTLTCGRPVRCRGSRLISLPIFNQIQQTKHHYIRHFNTVLMNVLT